MAFFKQTITSVPLEHKTVLVRADYNVPLNEDGTIADDFRIRASLPTLRKLLRSGCKVVIISHLGRPNGRDEKLSLAPVAERLSELLEKPVQFVDEAIGDKPRMFIKKAPKNSVTLLENLRFYKGEEANDAKFAQALAKASGAQYFVQDGFGVVHRAHASTAAITQYLPSVAGMLLKRECQAITRAMKTPKRPLAAVLGGAKVSDKIEVITALIDVADTIYIGGAMANTFLASRGIFMGKSRVERGVSGIISSIYAKAAKRVGSGAVDSFLILPKDLAVERSGKRVTVALHEVGKNDLVLDIGDASIQQLVDVVSDAETVIWNGTLGVAERPEFAHGSARLALALATHPDSTSVVGGGDTADFVLGWDARGGKSFSHVSTGGGASLELMAGKKLPGIESLLGI
jgi:phosphoglycerate kinase